ncbi:MAG: DUF5009 domain-containing protein [Chlorobi bacterium]|nr:DUF5009 domain-containing protein [Chlorobiota bacterium]
MNQKAKPIESLPKDRLLSLDFFRGITMFLLIGESAGIYHYMVDPSLKGSVIWFLGNQLHHHPWNGLHFWDLVQPFFMFIVGVAIPFSVAKRQRQGQKPRELLKHAVSRSVLLLIFGWALYCIGPGKITFYFQNVLAQLSVTYIVAFLIRNKSFSFQLVLSLVLIGISEVLYRTFPVEGFNHPFVANQNFGTWLDLQYGGADLRGHWVSFNAIPTTAHTIWGVLAGKLLLSEKTPRQKVRALAIAGLIGIIAGYALNPLTPIIKRIATSSFVIVSGGWALLVLAASYWLIDMKKSRKWVIFFAVVGMNPLFIYLFANVGGSGFLEHIIIPFTKGLFGWTGEVNLRIITSLLVWTILWYITWWMYKQKIFIKI